MQNGSADEGMTTSIAKLTSSLQEDFIIAKIKVFPLVLTAEIRVWNIQPIGGLENSGLISSIILKRAELKDMYPFLLTIPVK